LSPAGSKACVTRYSTGAGSRAAVAVVAVAVNVVVVIVVAPAAGGAAGAAAGAAGWPVGADAAGPTLAASYAYAVASGLPSPAASFTNNAAASGLAAYVWLSGGDAVTVTATLATNSPTLRLMTERYFLQEPANQPAP
jgi:hypothetical protein